MIRTLSIPTFCLVLLGCNPVVPPAPSTTTPPSTLAEFFDCVRENEGTLISAHRGGPSAGFAENGLPALQNTTRNGLALLEIDVRTSADGVLFLLHDDTLDRTTNGSGNAEDLNWAALARVELVDESGENTQAGIPRFEDVLDWARTQPAVLQLDVKGRTRLADLVRMVRNANMDQRVMIITYTEDQAVEAARLAPDIPLSISINEIADFYWLTKKGIDPEQIIAWTGLKQIKPALYKSLKKQGVESIYGALGAVDARASRDQSGAPYQNLVKNGVHIIATDRTQAARDAIEADERAQAACPLPSID